MHILTTEAIKISLIIVLALKLYFSLFYIIFLIVIIIYFIFYYQFILPIKIIINLFHIYSFNKQTLSERRQVSILVTKCVCKGTESEASTSQTGDEFAVSQTTLCVAH